MNETDLFRRIRPKVLEKAISTLAKGTNIREDLRSQLNNFFNRLEQSIETGNSAWLDTILQEWSVSQTQTELSGEPTNLTQFINQLNNLSYEIFREYLDDSEVVRLMDSLTPLYGHIFVRIAEIQIKAQIQQASELHLHTKQSYEKLEHSKSAFISVAAHELRTPLTLIEGYATMVQDHLKREQSVELALPMTQGILNGTARLQNIINDMVYVSLIDNNLIEVNHQPVWINQVLQTLRFEIKDIIKERNQNITIKDFEGSKEMIFADPDGIMTVFRKLLMNAIKFTPDGGSITIDGRKLPGFIEITLSDTGIGVPIDDQSTIFERFGGLGEVSLHSTSKTNFKGGGPGLGLYIAKGIIEAHEGAIWVESPINEKSQYPGSTFHILLPQRKYHPQRNKDAEIFMPIVDKTDIQKPKDNIKKT